jgi:TonB family protein
VAGKSEWEGSLFAFGHHTFEAVALLPDSTGAQNLEGYAIAVDAGGRVMPGYSSYWVESEDGSILAATDPDMKDLLMVSKYSEKREPAPAGTVSVYKTLPDSVRGMIFAFDKYPEIVHRESPVYPEEAVKAKAQGMVMVMITIDEFGDVINQWVAESDHDILNQPAMDAAKKFKFIPASQRGHRVKCTITVPFRFSLQR